MSERKHIGYIYEAHVNFEQRSWIADQDLKTTEPKVKEVVQGWLFGLSEPWSHPHYRVNYNYKSNSEDLKVKWKAEYISNFYDGLASVAFGYGPTPEEAIENVNTFVTELLEKYYEGVDEEPKPILTEEKLNLVKEAFGLK